MRIARERNGEREREMEREICPCSSVYLGIPISCWIFLYVLLYVQNRHDGVAATPRPGDAVDANAGSQIINIAVTFVSGGCTIVCCSCVPEIVFFDASLPFCLSRNRTITGLN